MNVVKDFTEVYLYTTFSSGFAFGVIYGYQKTDRKIQKQKYDDLHEITNINLLTMNMLKYGCQGGLMFAFLPITLPLYRYIYSSKLKKNNK